VPVSEFIPDNREEIYKMFQEIGVLKTNTSPLTDEQIQETANLIVSLLQGLTVSDIRSILSDVRHKAISGSVLNG